MKITIKKSPFYKNIGGKYVECNGYMFNYCGIDFAVCKTESSWGITHVQTGFAIGVWEKTRKECFNNLIKSIPSAERCKELFREQVVEQAIDKYGVNPMYGNKEENMQPDFFTNFINMGKTINV